MPGFPPGAQLKGGAASAPVNRELAREFYEPIIPVVVELRQGLSLRQIAAELDRQGIKTRVGCWYESATGEMTVIRWSATQVKRVLARAGAVPAAAATRSAARGIGQPAVHRDARGPQGGRSAGEGRARSGQRNRMKC